MWWSIVVPERHQRPEDAMSLGSWNVSVIGDRVAKKAAKAAGREYIRRGGRGQPRLIKSPMKLDGSMDMTSGSGDLSADEEVSRAEPTTHEDDELFEHILSGRDAFEGSPFYGDHPDDVLEEMELLFRDSGWAVVAYRSGLVQNMEERPPARIAGLMGFGGVTAQGEFWAQCRRRNRHATDEWLSQRYEAMLGEFTQTSQIPLAEAEALVQEARAMIELNWEQVMALATAKLAPSVDVDGREIKFLRDIYGDPDDE